MLYSNFLQPETHTLGVDSQPSLASPNKHVTRHKSLTSGVKVKWQWIQYVVYSMCASPLIGTHVGDIQTLTGSWDLLQWFNEKSEFWLHKEVKPSTKSKAKRGLLVTQSDRIDQPTLGGKCKVKPSASTEGSIQCPLRSRVSTHKSFHSHLVFREIPLERIWRWRYSPPDGVWFIPILPCSTDSIYKSGSLALSQMLIWENTCSPRVDPIIYNNLLYRVEEARN